MADRIGGRPPGPPPGVKEGGRSTGAGRPSPQRLSSEGSDSTSQASSDRFERGGQAAQGLRGQTGPAQTSNAQVHINRAQFGNLDLARLAEDFAVYMLNNPKASRSKRAREFVRRALKKNPRLAHLIQAMGDEAAEQMFDAVGDALEGSPVLGQTLDDVSDEAGRAGKKRG